MSHSRECLDLAYSPSLAGRKDGKLESITVRKGEEVPTRSFISWMHEKIEVSPQKDFLKPTLLEVVRSAEPDRMIISLVPPEGSGSVSMFDREESEKRGGGPDPMD